MIFQKSFPTKGIDFSPNSSPWVGGGALPISDGYEYVPMIRVRFFRILSPLRVWFLAQSVPTKCRLFTKLIPIEGMVHFPVPIKGMHYFHVPLRVHFWGTIPLRVYFSEILSPQRVRVTRPCGNMLVQILVRYPPPGFISIMVNIPVPIKGSNPAHKIFDYKFLNRALKSYCVNLVY
jgi:hypothetical protein